MRLSAIALVCLMPASALAAADCKVVGSPSEFGVDMIGYFAIKSGETCNFPIRIPGMMNSSGIERKPSHGTLTQRNVTTFTYTAARGYTGSDSFAVYGVGKGPYGAGRSVVTVNATIQ